MFRWRLPLPEAFHKLFTPKELDRLYDDNAELWGYHITGAPGYLTQDNIATILGIANGRGIHYLSLLFMAPAMNAKFQQLEKTEPAGSLITLEECPIHQYVEYTPPEHVDFAAWPDNCTLHKGQNHKGQNSLLIPITFAKKPSHPRVLLPSGRTAEISLRVFDVELALAITFHKIIGKTLKAVCIALRPHTHIPLLNHADLLLATSRVKGFKRWRFLPLAHGETLDHLHDLLPDIHVRNFLAGFDNDGLFNFPLARQRKAQQAQQAKQSKSQLDKQSMQHQPGFCAVCKQYLSFKDLTFCTRRDDCSAHACTTKCAFQYFHNHKC